MNFVQNLVESIRKKNSVVCMGLDPYLDEIRKCSFSWADTWTLITRFNKAIIDATHDIIPIIKPNIAFYEKYMALDALRETIRYAHSKGLLVILDSKRGDVYEASEAYAYATFVNYKADACTLNAYFGFDSIKPYVEHYPDKGIFIIVKSSNPSSHEFQDSFVIESLDEMDLEIGTIADPIDRMEAPISTNYLKMAELVEDWSIHSPEFGNFNNMGVVAGATFPDELDRVRQAVPRSFILIPGYKTQGGTVKDVKHGFYEDGMGAIVNSSRGIMFAYKNNDNFEPKQFAEAAREEVISMNKEINREIGL